jgi:pilus assembly protein CpaD
MKRPVKRILSSALTASLALTLVSCGGMPTNRSLYSLHQPVVERSSIALDVTTNASGIPVAEQRRIAGWFEAMDLGYGDRVSVEDPLGRDETRAAVAELTGRYGLLLADAAPVSSGDLQPGQARIVIQRSRASVPGCPDWSAKSDAALSNGISPGYGCATNGNMASMIADPEDLIKGRKGSTDTYINTSNTTIKAYSAGVGTKSSGGTGGN